MSIQDSMQASAELVGALQDLLNQIVAKLLGGPSQGKGGEPLTDVCYMQLPLGQPIDPRQYSFPWSPAGGDSSSDIQDDGKTGTAPVTTALAGQAPGAAAPPAGAPAPDKKLMHAYQSAYETAIFFDLMLRVTDDGSYRPFTSAGTLSSSYETVVTQAQGLPAPPLDAATQKKIDDAMHVLYVYDDAGNQTGKTAVYKNYQKNMQKYTQAEADYANAYAAAMSDAALGAVWGVAGAAYKTAVDNAYDDWRSADAKKVEDALDTVNSKGGSIGTHFVAQANKLFSLWSLQLAGAVAASTPYTEVSPATWYDPNDTDNGFAKITASNSHYRSSSASQSAKFASSWYQGHSSSTSGGGGGMLFGVTFGASGGGTSSSGSSGSASSGSQSSAFGASLSNVSIKLEYGLCTIFRPWLLRELFVIKGWCLPGQKPNVVSDGTIGGQKGNDDKHMLPMIVTQFLVVRNVTISANGWGEAGRQMSQYSRAASASDSSSSSHMSGSVGFLCFGGTVSHDNADWSGSDAQSDSAAGSCYFEGDENHGTLIINGCQIVGYIGEIVPAAPKEDGTGHVAAPAAHS